MTLCEYGEAVCEYSSTKIKWSCPAGQKPSARAFWGREAGDKTTCFDSSKVLKDCPGDDEKAVAAVTER